jgi:hypothetical protein
MATNILDLTADIVIAHVSVTEMSSTPEIFGNSRYGE